MPQHAPAPARRCPHCDGHATAAITTGPRDPSGTLPTLTVACPACHGTGTAPRTRPARATATH
ncbi:hypothetical protein LO771_19930 [Streptacidiphilus sp. ASG 303]|nr:hypothetical protein [Streptacidiphilus sp. ASG 303]MCD0484602.1 hypothetical protein [Streptacidiphilus sp. ASG 303]